MARQKLYYEHEGQKHPLLEGEYDTAFKVYKSDRRKAEIGNPLRCIEALGMRRLPNVAFAHIGSGGNAYAGFHDKKSPTGITVRHFLIPAAAQRVRDSFDTKGSPSTQVLMLKAPSNGNTLSHRRAVQKKRHDAVKVGAAQRKKREKLANTREQRLGIGHRPRPKIVKDGGGFAAVTLPKTNDQQSADENR